MQFAVEKRLNSSLIRGLGTDELKMVSYHFYPYF